MKSLVEWVTFLAYLVVIAGFATDQAWTFHVFTLGVVAFLSTASAAFQINSILTRGDSTEEDLD